LNSRWLAVPQWQTQPGQSPLPHFVIRVVTIDPPSSFVILRRFVVVQLISFENTTLRGIASPLHEPSPFELDISPFVVEAAAPS